MGGDAYGINRQTIGEIVGEIKAVADMGVQIGVVIGGGNIFRGAQMSGMGLSRPAADSMGMLGTVMNAIALEAQVEALGHSARAMSGVAMPSVVETYTRQQASDHLKKGRIVILAGGTGNPFFTTDTTAALRAVEIDADAILMGKNGTDGVYTGDPRTDPDAELLREVGYIDVLNRGLKVMDSTAITLCMDNRLPICVFDLMGENLAGLLAGEHIGTVVS